MTMKPELPEPSPSTAAHVRGIFDRNRLAEAWENNVQTQREVLVHLKRAHQSNLITRYISIGVLMVIVSLVYVVGLASRATISATKTAETERRTEAAHTEALLVEQDRKLALVLDSMTRLLEAKLAEDASKARPKDVELKAEVTRSRAAALVTTLEAKQAVATPAAAKAAGQQLEGLKAQAREKGVDLQGPAPAAIPLL